MVRITCLLVALLIAAPVSASSSIPDGPFGLTGTLEERFGALSEGEAEASEWRSVEGQAISIGLVTVELVRGVVTPIVSAGDITIGHVFRGSCTVSYRPPAGTEAASFRRGTGRDAWEAEPCDSAILLTDDEALLARLGAGAPGAAPGKLTAEHKILLQDVLEGTDLATSALARHLGTTWNEAPFFELVVHGGQFGVAQTIGEDEPARPSTSVAVTHRPQGLLAESEGVAVEAFRRFGLGKHHRLLTVHPLVGPPRPRALSPSVQVTATDLDLQIDFSSTDTHTSLDARARLTFTPTLRPVRAVLLSLAGGAGSTPPGPGEPTPLQVSAVTDQGGEPLPFVHRAGQLLVRLGGPLGVGESAEIVVSYAGSGVEKNVFFFGMFANWDWFPAGPGRPLMDWRLRVCLPDAAFVAATGIRVSSEVADGRRCEVHEAAAPVSFPALAPTWWDGIPRETNRRTLRAWMARADQGEEPFSLGLADKILTYYETIYGPLPQEEVDLVLAESFRGYWQAPHGLVSISRSWNLAGLFAQKIFLGDFIEDFEPYLLAHELAHQFWGHLVAWGSYRDQWISESFADYSAYLVLTQAGSDSAGYHQWWRRSGGDAGRRGVMTLGVRNGRLYQPLVYSRGPMLIHMFRRMVGDEAFFAWLRTIVDVARSKVISTEDIIVVGEHVVGPDARWFWEQWLERPEVPDLGATWTRLDSGVRLTLTQQTAGPPLRLIIPVLMKSKGGRAKDVLYQIAIETEELTLDLPSPTGGLRAVELDPYEEMVRGEVKVTRVR